MPLPMNPASLVWPPYPGERAEGEVVIAPKARKAGWRTKPWSAGAPPPSRRDGDPEPPIEIIG